MKWNPTILQFVFAAFIPVIIGELTLLPFWFAYAHSIYPSWLPLTQLSLTGLFIPLYLAAIGSKFILRNDGWRIFSILIVLILAVLFAVFLSYSNWGISTHLFWTPDPETLMINHMVVLCAMVIALCPPVLILLFRYLFMHFRRHT
jgi:hypothetical protein